MPNASAAPARPKSRSVEMAPTDLPFLSPIAVSDVVRAALREDLGRAGDITSAATIGADATASANFVARDFGVVSGLPLAEEAFRTLDPGARFDVRVGDGQRVADGAVIATVSGNARALLSAERVALNFLSRLSGIATATAAFVERVRHTRARIADTRKTTPGLRVFEKYAVRCGGGVNHRFGLDDAILIKDNHIAACGSVAEAVRRAKAAAGHLTKVEVEIDSLDQLEDALRHGPDVVMLDNFDPGA